MTRKKSHLSLQTSKSHSRTAKVKRRPLCVLSPFKSPLKKLRKIEKPSPLKNLSDFFTSPKKTPKSASRSLEFEEGLETQISTSVTEDFPQDSFYDRKDSETSEHINEKEIEDDYDISEFQKLLPDVVKTLEKAGRLDLTFLSFFRQVSENRFPLNNIAFLLWTEVVKWYECTSSTEMRYSKDTKIFWKLGWRIFGGRFANFRGGYKNQGENTLKLSAKGNYSPESSDINFAVPDLNVLRYFDPYEVKGDRYPGLYEDIMANLSVNLKGTSACLTFDGKKMKQVLSDDIGDVDLLGFEDGINLQQRREHLQSDLQTVQSVSDMLQNENDDCSVSGIQEPTKARLKEVLLKTLQETSEKIVQTRDLRKRKEYGKAKLIERGGNLDWRKGKYVYAVSAIIAFIHDIDEYLRNAVKLTEHICECLAEANECVYNTGSCVNLETHHSYVDLENQIGEKMDTRFIKQRSPEWFSLRERAKVTGSTLYQAIGCDSLKKQQDRFEKVICGIPEKEPSDDVKKAMTHGSDNEPNAVATIVGRVIPVLEPNLVFCEEGCVCVETENGNVFMVISPDGSLRKDSSFLNTRTAIEIKCPINQIHATFPPRYYLQCLAEMEALNTDTLLYVCWTEDETLVYRVIRNKVVFQKAMKIALDIYEQEKPKKQTRLSVDQKVLKDEIREESKKVKLVGRFSSLKSGDTENTNNKECYTVSEVKRMLDDVCKCYSDHFQINREKASEAVVFLVADLNRSWEKDSVRCSPVAWFPKGYSLTATIMRNIAEHVHTKCHEYGIHIPCESFDGQWHSLVVRTVDGKPLTVLQLQKDIWRETEKMRKKEIVEKLINLKIAPQWIVKEVDDDVTEAATETQSRKVIEVTNGPVVLPETYPKRQKENDPEHCEDTVTTAVTLADVIPHCVQQSDENVLELAEISDEIEMESLGVNIDEETWATEIERQQIVQEETEMDENNIASQENVLHTTDSITRKKVCELNVEDMQCILALFKTTKDCNKNGKWNDTHAESLLEFFDSTKTLNKLLDVELRVIVRYIKKTKRLNASDMKESSTKRIKILKLSEYLNIENNQQPDQHARVSKKTFKVKSLADMATQSVMKMSKQDLNIVYAEFLWKGRYDSWKSNISDVTVNDEPYAWFYQPELSSRGQYEVKCIDSTHLLTRTRRKCCSGGLEGLTNEAWLKVAKSKKTLLTPIMVKEIIDPMSVSMAKTHFSEAVEQEMRSNGDEASANLCRDVRSWWDSEDKGGIPASQRLHLRDSLKRRLTSKVNFQRFPPPTMHIDGWPLQLWEGILANIDAKTWLYSLANSGTYNVRAFSSMIGETFFSELTLNDKRGQGTLTCQEVAQFIGNTIEQLQIRLDPERKFAFCTSKRTVYELVEDASMDGNSTEHASDELTKLRNTVPRNIQTMDHFFDTQTRARLAERRKAGTVSCDRHALQKGALGVRWERARCNLSKQLPTDILGMSPAKDT